MTPSRGGRAEDVPVDENDSATRIISIAADGVESDGLVGGSMLGMALAALCFLIVLAAIGWGIYEIYQIGHPAPK